MKTNHFDRVPFLFGAAWAKALPGPVLIALMADLGGSKEAAKTVVHRMTRYGLLSLTRHGRVGVYRLDGQVRIGFEAIRDGATAQPNPADEEPGRFHAVVYDVPEFHRSLRASLRTALERHGYRQYRPGVMVGVQDRSARLVDLLGRADAVCGWWQLEPQAAARLARTCWPVADLEREYRRCIVHLDEASLGPVKQGADALRTLYEVTRQAYALQADGATIPVSALPPTWPGRALERATRQVWQRFGPRVSAHVDEVVAASPHRGLVELDPGFVSPG